MADNYLEKKMADYRAGLSLQHRATHTSRPSIYYPRRSVLVAADDLDIARMLISTFADAACVVFALSDDNSLQGCGARIYKGDDGGAYMLEDIRRRGEHIDVVISDRVGLPVSARTIFVSSDGSLQASGAVIVGGSPRQIALTALWMAHRDIDVSGTVYLTSASGGLIR